MSVASSKAEKDANHAKNAIRLRLPFKELLSVPFPSEFQLFFQFWIHSTSLLLFEGAI